jgi:hypothetical protein
MMVYHIKPLSWEEDALMRVSGINGHYGTKTYFCDLLCYYRFRMSQRPPQHYHFDGYYPMTARDVLNDYNLLQSKRSAGYEWRLIPWLSEAYESVRRRKPLMDEIIYVANADEKIAKDLQDASKSHELYAN